MKCHINNFLSRVIWILFEYALCALWEGIRNVIWIFYELSLQILRFLNSSPDSVGFACLSKLQTSVVTTIDKHSQSNFISQDNANRFIFRNLVTSKHGRSAIKRVTALIELASFFAQMSTVSRDQGREVHLAVFVVLAPVLWWHGPHTIIIS